MSCPTCDHTMTVLGYCNGGTWYYCPRCGTVRHQDVITKGDPPPTVYVPKLVERCREFQSLFIDQFNVYMGQWQRLGIAESIHKPEERPT